MANAEGEDANKLDDMAASVSSSGPPSKSAAADPGERSAVPCLIPTFADACNLVNAQYSCLVVDTHRRHVALSPMYLKKKKTGLQEQLNTDLLKYSESLKGVPIAYDNIKILGKHGDIYDDQGYIHMDIEAAFVTFRPKKGQKLLGVINKVGVNHVGCLVHGCFNASVPKPHQVTLEQWQALGLTVGDSLEFEVFQLDADVAGVLLIRGRLDKNRFNETQPSTIPEEDLADGEGEDQPAEVKRKKKKKKKDKEKDGEVSGTAISVDELPVEDPVNEEVDLTPGDPNMNGHVAEGKRKKKKHKNKRPEEEPEPEPEPHEIHEQTGEPSDKAAKKKRKRPSEDDVDKDVKAPGAKKKRRD